MWEWRALLARTRAVGAGPSEGLRAFASMLLLSVEEQDELTVGYLSHQCMRAARA